MPSNRIKRKNDKKGKSNKFPKVKRSSDKHEQDIGSFTDGCNVVSSILEEGQKDQDGKLDDITSIASDTLLCLEEVYCETNSSGRSPVDSLVRVI